MKEILFISGESHADSNLQCDEEYLSIKRKIDASDFKRTYYVTHLPNSLILDIDEFLKEHPAVIHYCGHGNYRGTLVVKQLEHEKILWNSGQLRETLEENDNLECLILCSCNSDKVIEEMGFPAKYMVGFKGDIKWKLAKKFNELYYTNFSKYGSPFYAYLRTIFILNRDRVRGIKPVFKSKINYVMKSILDYQEELLQKNSDLAEYREAIDFAEKTRERINHEIEVAGGQATGILYDLLSGNPFAREILYVLDAKEQIADIIAAQVFFVDSQENERSRLSLEITLLIDTVGDTLAVLRLNKYPDSEFKKICKTFSKEVYHNVLSRLAQYKFPIKTNPDFTTMWQEAFEEVKDQIQIDD